MNGRQRITFKKCSSSSSSSSFSVITDSSAISFQFRSRVATYLSKQQSAQATNKARACSSKNWLITRYSNTAAAAAAHYRIHTVGRLIFGDRQNFVMKILVLLALAVPHSLLPVQITRTHWSKAWHSCCRCSFSLICRGAWHAVVHSQRRWRTRTTFLHLQRQHNETVWKGILASPGAP